MVGEDDVAEGDAYPVKPATAVISVRGGAEAQGKWQSIVIVPGDIAYVNDSADLVADRGNFEVTTEGILARGDLGQSHDVAMARVGVFGAAGRGANHLLEDQNGARLERVNWLGNTAPRAIQESFGIMVNYLYDHDSIEANHEAFVHDGAIARSTDVDALLQKPN